MILASIDKGTGERVEISDKKRQEETIESMANHLELSVEEIHHLLHMNGYVEGSFRILEVYLPHKVWFDWGGSPDEIQYYAFNTIAELNAFLEGVSATANASGMEDFQQFDTPEEVNAYLLHCRKHTNLLDHAHNLDDLKKKINTM